MTPRCEVCSRHPGPQDDGSHVVLYTMPVPPRPIRWRCTDCGGGPRGVDAPRNQPAPDPTRYADHRKHGAGWKETR